MKPKNKPALAATYAKFTGTPHRMTKQRKLILRTLAAGRRYLSASELHVQLRSAAPSIGLATVYRALETLRELGLVTVMQVNGEAAYLFCGSGHHHHAVCTRCGRVDDVPCRSVSRLERMLSQGLRFRLTEHQMEFFGLCAHCT